jgi:hypothetical protein
MRISYLSLLCAFGALWADPIPTDSPARSEDAIGAAAPAESEAAPAALGRISGRVLSAMTGRPIGNASIEAEPGGRQAQSDSAGRFALDSLAPGTYDLSVSHPGYFTGLIRNVILVGDRAEEREIDLSPRVLDLAAKRVKAAPASRIYGMPNSTHSLDAEDVRRAPGALMDVQRAVQKFPGVQSRGDNVNEVIARGGFPGENQFLLDGIEVPNPNYFGNAGTGGGVISVVNPLLVKKLTFNAGAPPARYGGKASSVLDISLREGNPDMILGGADLGFAGAGILAEGPLWPGATFLSSFRKSYLDLVAEFEPSTAIPSFWGGQGKVTQKAGDGTLTADGLYGKSSIRIEDAEDAFGADGDVIEAGGEVYATGLSWRGYSGDKWEFSATASGTGNVIRRKQGFAHEGDWRASRILQEYENGLKGEIDYFAENKSKWSLGAEARALQFRDANQAAADTLKAYLGAADSVGAPAIGPEGTPVARWNAPGATVDDWRGAAFASANFPLTRRAFASLGLRAEAFGYSDAFALEPRASLGYLVNDELELDAGAGLQTQPQEFPDYTARAANRDLPSKRAVIASLESQWTPRKHVQIGLTGYVKAYDHLLYDSALVASRPFAFLTSPARLSDGTALSRGLELYAERKLAGHWFASLAYAYSISETSFPDIDGGRAYPSDFDYTHLANATGGAVYELLPLGWYRALRQKTWFKSLCWIIPLGDRVEGSFRFRYATGRPFTPQTYDQDFRRWRLETDRPNTDRFPDYYTLDLRLERRIGYGWLRMMFYFDFQNVTVRDNVFTYMYNDKTGKRVTVKQLPFFPMGGFIIGF